MTTTAIQYNPHDVVVSACLDFLATLKGVKILPEANLQKTATKNSLTLQEEKRLFFAGSKSSMSKHFEKYL